MMEYEEQEQEEEEGNIDMFMNQSLGRQREGMGGASYVLSNAVTNTWKQAKQTIADLFLLHTYVVRSCSVR